MARTIKIKNIIRPIDLGEYADEYKDEMPFYVWANLPRTDRINFLQLRKKMRELKDQGDALRTPPDDPKKREKWTLDEEKLEKLTDELEELTPKMWEFWSLLWSQHSDNNTHLTPEEVKEFAENCQEFDPGLWDFLTLKTLEKVIGQLSATTKK